MMASDLLSHVNATIGRVVKAGDRLVVGLSGGLDSVALLDILARLARRRRFRLSAIHVNHQLSPNAARWAEFCRALCRGRGIPLRVTKVTVARGDSLEATARAERYQVFRRLAADYVVLAHNQDDQVETLLLQLLRGAGVKGLAAMPFLKKEAGAITAGVETCKAWRGSSPATRYSAPAVMRPLLDIPRSEIARYARRRKLEWIEDESNLDTYFLRNFLRHEVLPLIATRYPGYRATLARSARHFAEAAQLLDEMAAEDGAAYVADGTLETGVLRKVGPERAKNLLRYFLSVHGVSMPAADRLEELLRQAVAAREDAKVRVELGDAEVRRFAGRLHVVRGRRALPDRYAKRWRGEKTLALPELGGVLVFERAAGRGISAARIKGKIVTIGVRRGGERLQPDCRRPRRSVKNLFQETRIPPWQRESTPVIRADGELVWVAGLGVDCAFQAKNEEAAIWPVWRVLPARGQA